MKFQKLIILVVVSIGLLVGYRYTTTIPPSTSGITIVYEELSDSCSKNIKCVHRFQVHKLLVSGKVAEAKQVLCKDNMVRAALSRQGVLCS